MKIKAMNKKLIPPVIATAITIAVFFNTKVFLSTLTGPILITFFALWSFQVSIVNKWKFNHLGILPCLIGIYGFLEGQASTFSYVADYMCSEHELPISTYALTANAMATISPALKVLLLGTGLSILLFTICTCVSSCRRPIKE